MCPGVPPVEKTSDALIAVRPDERFDEARLAAYLSGKLAGASASLQVRQYSGGKANLTYRLRFAGGRDYVLRRPPLGSYPPSAHDMGRENTVLSALDGAFPFAPRVYHYCADETVLGAPFIVMERCQGVVVRERMPPQFAAMHAAPQQMSAALVDALAAFHALEYEALGLARLGKPDGFIQRQVAGWSRRWERAKLADSPDISAVQRWLRARIPKASAASLVHNDYKLDNVMFAADDPARLVAILDWDMCTLGDPLSDLGALLTYWAQPDDPPAVKAIAFMPAGDFAFYSRREIIERYAAASGRDVGNLRFYHVLGIFRLLVILQQIYLRYTRGQTQDRRFADMHKAVAALAGWAQERIAAADD